MNLAVFILIPIIGSILFLTSCDDDKSSPPTSRQDKRNKEQKKEKEADDQVAAEDNDEPGSTEASTDEVASDTNSPKPSENSTDSQTETTSVDPTDNKGKDKSLAEKFDLDETLHELSTLGLMINQTEGQIKAVFIEEDPSSEDVSLEGADLLRADIKKLTQIQVLLEKITTQASFGENPQLIEASKEVLIGLESRLELLYLLLKKTSGNGKVQKASLQSEWRG